MTPHILVACCYSHNSRMLLHCPLRQPKVGPPSTWKTHWRIAWRPPLDLWIQGTKLWSVVDSRCLAFPFVTVGLWRFVLDTSPPVILKTCRISGHSFLGRCQPSDLMRWRCAVRGRVQMSEVLLCLHCVSGENPQKTQSASVGLNGSTRYSILHDRHSDRPPMKCSNF